MSFEGTTITLRLWVVTTWMKRMGIEKEGGLAYEEAVIAAAEEDGQAEKSAKFEDHLAIVLHIKGGAYTVTMHTSRSTIDSTL
jgi:hypothetical protein